MSKLRGEEAGITDDSKLYAETDSDFTATSSIPCPSGFVLEYITGDAKTHLCGCHDCNPSYREERIKDAKDSYKKEVREELTTEIKGTLKITGCEDKIIAL